MLRGAIPGETVRAAIVEEKKDYLKAVAVEIESPSPDRTEPECPLFGTCGGCLLQYISHAGQLRLKEEVLRDCLKRQAGIEMPLSPSLINETCWHYRMRVQLKVSQGKIGFYRENTREVIPVDYCPVSAGPINRILREVQPLISSTASADVFITSGDCAVALIRLPSNEKKPVPSSQMADELIKAGFAGVFIINGNGPPLNYGALYTSFRLGELFYTVSPMTFCQGHWMLNEKTVAFVHETLRPFPGKKVLDLYAGAGNLSLPLALDAEEVVAVEENPYALKDARRNLALNNISNCRFIHSSAESFCRSASAGFMCDIIILDPPRPGLSNVVISAVLSILPERIVYMSCNPPTLARDLEKLLGRYEVESVRMADFFPQTHHIESLVFLRRLDRVRKQQIS